MALFDERAVEAHARRLYDRHEGRSVGPSWQHAHPLVQQRFISVSRKDLATALTALNREFLIEKAARAAAGYCESDSHWELNWELFADQARAVLTAVGLIEGGDA